MSAKKQTTKAKCFETCQIELKIRSGSLFTQYINKISPPEYLVLQQLHGPEAVKFIEKQGPDIMIKMNEHGKWLKRPVTAAEMLQKLQDKYKVAFVSKVFPGANPVLPYDFDSISLTLETQEEIDESGAWEPMETDELTDEELEKATAPRAVG